MNNTKKNEHGQSHAIRIARLKLSQLVSSQPYQRGLNKRLVDSIDEHFDARLLGVITVSAKGDQFHVIDGQHRISALKQKFGGDVRVPCEVHEGLTYKEEAALYVKMNVRRRPLTPIEVFQGELESGNEEAIKIDKLVRAAGMAIIRKGCGQTNGMSCVRKLKIAFKTLGEKTFSEMMQLLNAAWGGEQTKINADVLGGVVLFLRTYGLDADMSRLKKKLREITPVEVFRNGRTDLASRGDVRFAKIIWQLYNKNIRESGKLKYKFEG